MLPSGSTVRNLTVFLGEMFNGAEGSVVYSIVSSASYSYCIMTSYGSYESEK